MKTNKKDLTTEESLRIINEMIETVKGNVRDKSYYFLLWGWIVILGSIGHYVLLKFTEFSRPEIAWLVVIIGLILSFIRGFQQGKATKVITHIDKVYIWVWMVFLVSYSIIIIFMSKINYAVTPLVFLLAGNATFLSGTILKFRPLIWGSIIMWIGAILTFFLSYEHQLIISPAIIVIGYLIPGYLLRMKKE